MIYNSTSPITPWSYVPWLFIEHINIRIYRSLEYILRLDDIQLKTL